MLCPKHDALQAGMLAGGDADQAGETSRVLGDIPHRCPLAIRTAVPSVIQREGDQPVFAEPPRNMLVTAGVLTEAVSQHNHRSRRSVTQPRITSYQILND
jgi:hypothetical protein